MAITADDIKRISDKYETSIYRADPTSYGRSITVIRCDRDCGVREVVLWGMDTVEPLECFFQMVWDCQYFIDPFNEDWRMFLQEQSITDEQKLKRIDYVAFPTNIDKLHEGEARFLFLNSNGSNELNTEMDGVPISFNMTGDLPNAIEWLSHNDVSIKIASHDTFTHPDCIENYRSKFAGQGKYASLMENIRENIGDAKSVELYSGKKVVRVAR